jgi:hypothetical protein
MSEITTDRILYRIKDDGSEESTDWQHIKAGIKFVIFEGTGEAITYQGWDIFVALADAKLADNTTYGVPFTVYVPELDETGCMVRA